MNKNEPIVKDFDGWNELAKKLENIKSPIFHKKLKKYLFHPREIWFCSIGTNIGVEICGKNKEFERPVLVLKKSGRQFVCLPLTSQKPNNPDFYIDISYTNPINKETVNSYVVITSPITCDVNRLQRKVRKISPQDFEVVRTGLTTHLNK
jgi:mRNA interferase MazF